MPNRSTDSSGSSVHNRVPLPVCHIPHGVPSECWCRFPAIPRTSHSEANPGRRYFRCAMAVEKLLRNDDHCFKWVDEALLDEWKDMKNSIEELERNVQDIEAQVEMTKIEVNKKMNKTVAVVVVLCIGISCLFKFF